MSTVHARVRGIIHDRDGGMCVRCIRARAIEQIHHRRPRAMGSSKRGSTNLASNLLGLCAECHLWIESHREESLDMGWLVRQNEEPVDVPVLYRGRFVHLDDQGHVFEVAA